MSREIWAVGATQGDIGGDGSIAGAVGRLVRPGGISEAGEDGLMQDRKKAGQEPR